MHDVQPVLPSESKRNPLPSVPPQPSRSREPDRDDDIDRKPSNELSDLEKTQIEHIYCAYFG